MSNWNDFEKYLKPHLLRGGGKPEVLTVTGAAIRKVYDPNSNKAEDRPVLYFAEYEQGLVVNERNRRGMIMLFGPESSNYKGKKIVLEFLKPNDEEDGVLTITGEWTEGLTWRQVQRRGRNADPFAVDVLNKPVVENGDSSPQSTPTQGISKKAKAKQGQPPKGSIEPPRQGGSANTPLTPIFRQNIIKKWQEMYGSDEMDAQAGIEQLFGDLCQVKLSNATYAQGSAVMAHLLAEQKKAKQA